MSIHPNFVEWYRSAAVGIPEGRLEKRWNGVEAVTRAADRQLVIALALLFILPGSDSRVPAAFREAFRNTDETFPMRDNLEEMRVLAGAVLHQLIAQEGQLALLASLALVAGAFGPRAGALPFPGHLSLAKEDLIKRSQSLRQLPIEKHTPIPSLKTRIPELLQQSVFQQNQLPSLFEPLRNILLETASSLEATTQSIDGLRHRVLIREEELNILWWLQNESSRDLQKPFRDIGYVAGSIVFPSELSDLVHFIPGPGAALAVILQALRLAGAPSSAEMLTLADATNATPRDWRERVSDHHALTGIELLCPVHLSVRKSLDTEGREEWYPVFRKICDIPIDQPFELAQVALQTYHERMLLALLQEKH